MSDEDREEWLRVRLDDLSDAERDQLFLILLKRAKSNPKFCKWLFGEYLND